MLNDTSLELAALQHLQWEAEPLMSQLEENDFHDPECKTIFMSLVFDGSVLDPSATEEKLKQSYRWLNLITNTQYMGAPHQILHRLRILRARREAKDFKSKAETEEIPMEFIEKSKDIRRMLTTRGETKLDLAERIKNGVPKTPTGFKRFDDLCMGGIENGGIMVIAAMPGAGKSALAVNIAKNIVAEGKSVCFLTLEMSSEAILTRLMQSFWGETVDKVKEHVFDMIDMPGNFHPVMPSNDIDKLLSEAMNYLEADLFIIDYFDLITSKSTENHTTKLETISHKIKDFAFSHNKPVIVLSQFNKELEKSASNREPILSDLHGTSALAKDAHIISFLWDKSVKDSETKSGDDHLESRIKPNTDLRWLIKKNRNGKMGMVFVDFTPETMTFRESTDFSFRL